MNASTPATKIHHKVSAASAMERPNITDERVIGSDIRSCTPVAAYPATPVAAGIPKNRIWVTRNPGTRKST